MTTIPTKPKMNSAGDRQCICCDGWVMVGASTLRGLNEYFVCYTCRHDISDIDAFIENYEKERNGEFELALTERDVFLLDRILQLTPTTTHLSIPVNDKYELANLSDIVDLKRKIGCFATVLRSSHKLQQPSVVESVD